MTQRIPSFEINPPLINSSNPWATTLDDLRSLYACTSTGAVTTRTSLIKGFDHDATKHQYAFFDAASHSVSKLSSGKENASLNCLGYSPIGLETYLGFIKQISDEQLTETSKGFIVSVTGTADEVAECYKLIASARPSLKFPVAMEVNLSCPNIPDKPPPAFSEEALLQYLNSLRKIIEAHPTLCRIPFGFKSPPYTYSTQYEVFIGALDQSAASTGVSLVSFITATNTLGSCLALSSDGESTTSFALPGLGVGGMAGAPLHPLALGNVVTLRRMLDERKDRLGHIRIIGIGGVLDVGGYQRMKAVGAWVVGIGTGLGLKGLTVFEEIEKELGGSW
ncbi:hypothetical protein OQA88_6439 [Cercophora sp. LCS_1]